MKEAELKQSIKKNANWIPDHNVYKELQKLLKFVDFIAKHEYSTQEDKIKTKEIKSLIENINKPKTYKNWNICLDIFDRDVQNKVVKEGFYWRKWSIFFEQNSLEIVAESKHTAKDIGHYGDDFYFHGTIFFTKDLSEKQVYMDKDINEFVNDAINYKEYITETLKDIEIDIAI